MFARVFIDRPVLAWVISLVIVLFGLAALSRLPIAQYPEVAPPTVTVSCTYPGANAQVVSNSVAAPIELQVNGVEGMLYMSSNSGNDGSYSLTVTFALGTDLNMAQVLVQNRVQQATPLLPEEVQRQGVVVRKRTPDILLIANLFSPDDSRDQLYLSNFATVQVRDEVARIEGVGDVTVFGQQDYSMKAWLDPDKLAANSLSASDVVNAMREQNVQVAAGRVGAEPATPGVAFQYTLNALGRLETVEQFRNIVVKSGAAPSSQAGSAPAGGDPAGATNGGAAAAPSSPTPAPPSDALLRPVVLLGDVARVELTARTQDITNTLDGKASVGLAIFALPGANALDVADRVKAKIEQLKKRFPPGVEVAVRYDTTPFIQQSVEEVYSTLFDATLLVAVVVLLFLQDWRAMILPMIDVPVSLVGTLAVMYVFGFSLNNLTLFGLVLAIGIVVDDAIVVLENVERWIAQGLNARDATLKAMSEITGPIIAITLVLSSVFLPSAFLGGVTGQFFRQFALTISVAMMISALNAMTLTPSRAAAIFRGREKTAHETTETLPRWGWALLIGYAGYRLLVAVFGPLPLVPPQTPAAALNPASVKLWAQWVGSHALYMIPGAVAGWFVGPRVNAVLRRFYALFNRGFDRTAHGYTWAVRQVLRGSLIVLAIYAGLLALTYTGFARTPTGYIPPQDQGYLLVSVQLPDAASAQRSRAVMQQIDDIVRAQPGVSNTLTVTGQSFVLGATGSNFGTMFVILEPFEARKGDVSRNGFMILRDLNAKILREVQDAQVLILPPPPVRGLGSAGGYRIMVEDRGDLGPEGLQRETNALIREINQTPALGASFTVYRANVPQLFVDVDRVRCRQMGVPLADVFATLQVYLGGTYVNDFNRFGRNWQVTAQADAPYRMSADTIRNLRVRNDRGEMVPLGSVAKIQDVTGPVVIQRYNTFPAAAVNGNLAPGTSTGTGIQLVTEAAERSLSGQAGYEWTDISFLQNQEGSTAIYAFIGAVLLVYLVLAGLYNSWSLPFAIILVVPMCILSAIGGIYGFALLVPAVAPEINIFTQIGFVVLVGLACKNAILIVEFAEQQRHEGKALREATLEAVRLRLRPIVMTSFAFILGVAPLVLAQGAGAEMRRTLGIAVFSGMLGVTFFGLVLTPVFYYLIERWLVGGETAKPPAGAQTPPDIGGPNPPESPHPAPAAEPNPPAPPHAG
ncbi:efflux RND transporter permease subunit [Gemmata sp. JC673]|uniref:Efflux RND transporter permease subunit n=1 Tax=Gemmata algarum TaxID=2975278 RepID=A0ABU5F7B9_9BACT|nr:efflux RND transporter permease subunit [Gemmata algarum]MDY3562620.1 efflux RND transporter permease subunit [Gemmata algarum]